MSQRTYKRLYGPAQLTGSAADLYTCPTATVTRTLHIHASNPSESPAALNLSIGTDATGTRVWDNFEIGADGVADVFDPYELVDGEKLQGWATAPADAYADEVMADSPAAYYRMNEASGLIQDTSGNGNHATTLAGTPTYGAVGAITSDPNDDAIVLTAVDSEDFSAPHHTSLNFGDVFTLEMWVRRTTLRGAGNEDWVISKYGAYCLGFYSDQIALGQPGIAITALSDYTMTLDNTWHHIVATKNGATQHIYLDGVDLPFTESNNTAVNSANDLIIGSEAGALNYDGGVDEIALYATALSAERIKAHFDAAHLPTITITGYEDPV